jgi:transposase
LRLDPSIRGLFGKLHKKGLTETKIAELLDTTRQTVHRWLSRAMHRGRESYRDKNRAPKRGKITERVELSILTLRNTLRWGTARIQ